MLDTEEQIEINAVNIERGYKCIHGAVKKYFRGHLWPFINLPSDQRQGLDAVLYNLMQTIELLDLESSDGRSLDVWYEFRDGLSDAFRDQCNSVELVALVDASRRFEIPKQYLFDPLRGADLWIRDQQFDSFEELESFCSYVGGSTMVATMPVLGVLKPNYDVAAIECGKAIMLTQLLANCINDLKRNKIFLAREDLEDCDVDLSLLKLRRTSKAFRYLIRLYVARIEKMFMGARHLVQHLDFDGKRTLKSLLGYHWQMLLNMQVEPERVLAEESVLSTREQLAFKSRHLLGMEKELTICEDVSAHH